MDRVQDFEDILHMLEKHAIWFLIIIKPGLGDEWY